MSKINNSNINFNSQVKDLVSIPKRSTSLGTAIEQINSKLSTGNSSSKSTGNINSFLSFDNNPNFIEVKVGKGDSLSNIAKKYLGKSSKYMEIFEANKDQLKNPNDLKIGMTLKIPVSFDRFNPVQPTKSVRPKARPNVLNKKSDYNEITVNKGDSLSTLALKHLGNSERYMEIFEANRDILKNPSSIKVGMKLKIPSSSSKPSDYHNRVTSISNVNNTNMTDRANDLYNSLKGYQNHHNKLGHTNRTKTTDAEMKEIAIELDKAGEAFDVDPKIMMAVYAHESGGFNPRARSHTGAGGLGQLTGIAIRQVHYMAGMAKGQKGRSPYTSHKSNFIQSQTKLSQRYNIKKNVWTSTAYMAYEIKDRNNGNIKRSLERYGDPNVSTYENKVNKEYETLFGSYLF